MTRRWRDHAGIVLLACLLVPAATASQAQDMFSSGGSRGRTSYPTGSQSRQPNDAPCANPFGCGRGTFYGNAVPYQQGGSVYCQQSPGQPMYGPYSGTGTNTPCGPAFQRAQPQQPPPPQPRYVSCSELGMGEAPLLWLAADRKPAAASSGLYIGARRVDPTSDKDYQCIVKYLTVPTSAATVRAVQPRRPSAGQADPLFLGTDSNAIKRTLEDPLRRQIVDAMAANPYTFHFATLASANENIDIRVETIRFMLLQGGASRSCSFAHGEASIESNLWKSALAPRGMFAPGGHVLNSLTPPNSAAAVIADFGRVHSSLDCLGGVEMAVFQSVAKIIGASRFEREHPEGLQNVGLIISSRSAVDNAAEDVPTPAANLASTATSIFKNIKILPSATQTAMVPGDWAYMRNDPNYDGNDWRGENTIYMGKYEKMYGPAPIYLTPSDPHYTDAYYARFTGLGGERDKSETELRNDLATNYENIRNIPVDIKKIGWTMLARIRAGDDAASLATDARPAAPPPTDVLGRIMNLFNP